MVRQNFGNGNFRKAWAPRSVGGATRGAKNHGKFPVFAMRLRNLLSPTWPAKILETKILAKHGRHAGFEAERGEPKVVVNSRDSRCVFGTFFVQLGPRKFWKRKFLKSMGTTQRWKQDAGRQKFCKISWLRGSPWDLCCCKVVFGPRKFWNQKFSQSMGATQRLKHDAGSQKLW